MRYYIARLAFVIVACMITHHSLNSNEKDSAMLPDTLPDLYDLWDYDDPAGSREKFEAILPAAESSADRSYYLQLLTQIARCYGLEGDFEKAHEALDQVEAAPIDELPIV